MRYTKADAIAMVVRAAEGRMDFIYNPGQKRADCAYVAGHQRAGEYGDEWDLSEARPDCLIGCALIGAGVVTMLEILDSGNNELGIDHLVGEMEDHTFDDDAVEFMKKAQLLQDRGYSWREAIQFGLTGNIK